MKVEVWLMSFSTCGKRRKKVIRPSEEFGFWCQAAMTSIPLRMSSGLGL